MASVLVAFESSLESWSRLLEDVGQSRGGTFVSRRLTTIRMSEETYNSLRQHLVQSYPEEDGAFAVIVEVPTSESQRVLGLRSLILPRNDEWMYKERDALTPTTDFINRAAVAAESLGVGLAFIHSHPDPRHPAGLSYVDEQSTRKLFLNLKSVLGDVPLASLVFTPKGFAGVVSRDGKSEPVRSLRILGTRIDEILASDQRKTRRNQKFNPDRFHDRQILAFGQEGQARIRESKIAVIGAGGTGSCILEQLARLGAEHVWLIDDDELERSNISRIYGSTPSDIRKHTLKVDIVTKHLRKISPQATITRLESNVLDHDLVPLLNSMDVIFCCTDTESSRARLNDIAYQGFVPVIDTGCRIHVSKGAVEGVLGRVRLLRPGLPCLWCTDTINGTQILHESLSEEERSRLAAEGYGSGVGPKPSVIHLTSTVASLAVNVFLSLVAGLGPPCREPEVLVDLLVPEITRVVSQTKPNCRCQRIITLPV